VDAEGYSVNESKLFPPRVTVLISII